ncbi:redox-sensing transcriptional repressor Rex [Hujiaoplasma nucleasis]|uniref:Redox-sensing transcriptional repressor Rex n=1 Tax=Hujiaoplasma nucleasis TaxID=2725268 RepID=A0A7L6N164_9MOLU|nr:redox-sensing transcriptional repressor Rex [Hujiaoplasma nucleasis]QLY39996.1 redox-sensing transcriptional repressor Rex [Hujiaoplasma nucleasis]
MLQNCQTEAFLERLPIYLNQLSQYSSDYVSASILAKDLGLGEVQVRKDLAKISRGGKPKVGYILNDLKADIERYMGFDQPTNAVIIGMGKLGRSLYNYHGFQQYHIEIIGAFDIRESFIHVDQLNEYCQEHHIDVAILTVPKDEAQKISDIIIKAGIKAIWNFSPTRLNVPSDVVVQNENLAVSLSILIKHYNDRRKNHGL